MILIFKGYVNEPIFPGKIDFVKCIPDMLHLFLRITDKLEDLLFNSLNGIDSNSQSIKIIIYLQIKLKLKF